MPIAYKIKTASEKDVLEHMEMCNATFSPFLENRVNLKDFAEKIFKNAITFEAWDNDDLVGLVSCYFNESTGLSGFINHVSVRSGLQGKGISSNLLEMCVQYGLRSDFREIALEVAVDNHIAINLYEKFGFVEFDSNRDEFVVMKKILNTTVL